jgi:hypothetical protein
MEAGERSIPLLGIFAHGQDEPRAGEGDIDDPIRIAEAGRNVLGDVGRLAVVDDVAERGVMRIQRYRTMSLCLPGSRKVSWGIEMAASIKKI